MTNQNFEGAKEVGKPASMTDEDCSSAFAMPFVQELPVAGTDQKMQVQCWLLNYKPSLEDLNALNAGEGIWLKIMSPLLPPHALWTMKPGTNEPNF